MPESKPITGFTVVRLATTADPDKGEEWLARQALEFTKEDFDREFLLQPVGEKDSYPVFNEYRKDLHEDATLNYKRNLQFVYRGWDFGRVHPCVEFLQPEHERVNVIHEIYGTNIKLVPFAEHVLADSALMFPGAKFVDWCDASGVNEKDDGRASIRVLKEDFKLTMHYRRREVENGVDDIAKYLSTFTNGQPKLKINPTRCPQLAEAMRGGYRRKPNGVIVKPSDFDHPVDAFRYAFYGITFNINAAIVRSKPKRPEQKQRPLSDCALFSRRGRV